MTTAHVSNELDQVAVDKFLAEAQSATVEQLRTVTVRMRNMIARGERARGTSIATMTATADALGALIRERTA